MEAEPGSTFDDQPPELAAFIAAFWAEVEGEAAYGDFSGLVEYFDPEIVVMDVAPGMPTEGPEYVRIMLQFKYGLLGDIRYRFSRRSIGVAVYGDMAVEHGYASEAWNGSGREGTGNPSYLAVYRRTDELGWRLLRLMMSSRGPFEEPGIGP